MADFDLQNLDVLSRRAKEWARYLENNSAVAADRDRMAITMGRVRNDIFAIIERNLNAAIQGTEFANPLLAGHLKAVLLSDDLVSVDLEGTVYFTPEDVAGNDGDFKDGIEAARERLGVGGTGTAEQRARIWKEFIYQPAVEGIKPEGWTEAQVSRAKHYYDRTIRARVEAWGGTAPFWLILEHGNKAVGGNTDLAYPSTAATNFLSTSVAQAQAVFDRALKQVIKEEGNALEDAARRFLNRPESFQPGEILGTFYAQGRKNYIYVTPVKRLVGVTVRRPG